MQFTSKSVSPIKAKHQCLIVGLYDKGQLTDTATLLDEASNGHLQRILKRGDITGKVGETLVLHDVPNIAAPRVLLVGLGDQNSVDGARFIKIAAAAIGALQKTQTTSTLCCLGETNISDRDLYWKSRRLVEQFHAGLYRFNSMRGTSSGVPVYLKQIDLLVSDQSHSKDVKRAIKDGCAVALGTKTAKDLANSPANICTPTYIAEQAKKLAKAYPSLTTTVLEEAAMKKLGMHSLLSVSQGSAEPAKLIIIRHQGGKAKDAPHVLVGKGITFDTGGISLKPPATMYEMIYDMCGAAAVFGAIHTAAELKLPINVIAVIAAAENMPSSTASRPGDIVKTMSGQTVEILNTDAEGRLVLCDALTYIDKFKPATVIDVATLTGAVVVALGAHASAVYANDEEVAQRINQAGENTLDRVWRMPLWDDYQSQLNSAFADMTNTGGRDAGSVTAACFLARFTKSYRWAHLDIAGTAHRAQGSDKAATGRPVNLLCQYLMDQVGS